MTPAPHLSLSKRRLSCVLLSLLFLACGSGSDASEARGAMEATSSGARSSGGMVSSAQPLATQAGVRMLEAGGNAVDAAVATAFALTVVEPSMNSLGGRTQMIIRTAQGSIHGIDATTQAPADYDYDSAPRASYGYPTVGIPGTVKGLTRALESYGTLPLEQVMAPAVEYAREGYPLSELQVSNRYGSVDQLRESEGAVQYFLDEGGDPYRVGDLFAQQDLTSTLEAIATGGAEAFYRGPIAERMAADMAAKGGAVTMEALAAYEAMDSEIVRGSYRGFDLAGLWLPSYGAITIEILQILETLPSSTMAGPEWAAAVAEAIRVAYQDREEQHTLEDAGRLTSKDWARERAMEMRLPAMAVAPMERSGVSDVRMAHLGGPPAWTENPGHTTSMAAASSDGTVVALTQSIGPAMGSKVAAPGLGFLYAATLGGYLGRVEPAERASSHISPMLVLQNGQPLIALGAAGGGRIPPAIVAALTRVIDQGMSLADALEAPRVYPDDGIEFDLEAGTSFDVGREAIRSIEAMGFEVDEIGREGAFGRVHAVAFDAVTGEWIGAADPDWDGTAQGPGGR